MLLSNPAQNSTPARNGGAGPADDDDAAGSCAGVRTYAMRLPPGPLMNEAGAGDGAGGGV